MPDQDRDVSVRAARECHETMNQLDTELCDYFQPLGVESDTQATVLTEKTRLAVFWFSLAMFRLSSRSSSALVISAIRAISFFGSSSFAAACTEFPPILNAILIHDVPPFGYRIEVQSRSCIKVNACEFPR